MTKIFCSRCGKEGKIWSPLISIEKNGKELNVCDKCFDYYDANKHEKKNKNSILKKESKKIDNNNERKVIQEYKRKCKECGKIWHSLVARENQILSSMKVDRWVGLGNIGNPGAILTKRNMEANNSELDKLRKCPECGSHNYIETIISFKR